MKSFRITPGFLALVATAAAAQSAAAFQDQTQPAAEERTMSRLAGSASEELERSIADLNRLREQVSAEKLPMSQELTAAEEKLVGLRKESDRVQRLVDAGALELATIKAETKGRQDELSYVAGILDEYARNFESKVHVSELQQYGEPLIAAKQAPENGTLTQAEKFARQITFAQASIRRLSDAVGGVRFAGVAVDLQGTVSDGQFLLMGPVALFRPSSGAAGIVVPQSGSDRPLVRPLEGPLQETLGMLVSTGEGSMPLDPTRGGALKALVQKTNLIHIFEKGGPIMWPLLVASILALGAVLERLVFLFVEGRRRDAKALDALFAEFAKGNVDAAVRIGRESKDFVVRTMGYALERKDQSLANALDYAQGREIKRFKRGIAILDTCITLAPLLGLLGTVTGMMGSFSLIGGELSAPGAITGGIAEALIATAFGLGIAITALIPFNYLNNRLDDAEHDISSAANQLKILAAQGATAGGA